MITDIISENNIFSLMYLKLFYSDENGQKYFLLSYTFIFNIYKILMFDKCSLIW